MFTKMCSGHEMVLVTMRLSDFMELEDGNVKLKEKPYIVHAADFYDASQHTKNYMLDFAREWAKKAAFEGLTYFGMFAKYAESERSKD